MSPAVRKWMEWADDIKTNKMYSLLLESVYVTKGSYLEEGWSANDPFRVQLSEQRSGGWLTSGMERNQRPDPQPRGRRRPPRFVRVHCRFLPDFLVQL